MELKDYSGPYRHELKWEDFSKEFLVKLMKSWQRAYLSIQGAWIETVTEKFGSDAADSCSMAVLPPIIVPLPKLELLACRTAV